MGADTKTKTHVNNKNMERNPTKGGGEIDEMELMRVRNKYVCSTLRVEGDQIERRD